jgi:class 3 adenylate cyclase
MYVPRVEMPEARYVITDDDVRIAYQVFGDGPATVLIPSPHSHLEALWEVPPVKAVYERMAANLCVATFDQRGTGMSDGFTESPGLEDRILDVAAVMNAVGWDVAHVVGYDVGAQIAVGFAAKCPDRVERLVLVNSRVGDSARRRATELNPDGEHHPAAQLEAVLAAADNRGVSWPEMATYFNPSLENHPDVLAAAPQFDSRASTRDAFRRQTASIVSLDVVDIAPLVQAPTLVLHARDDRFRHVGHARVLDELVPNSTLIEYPGIDHMFWLADNWRDIVDAQIRFITEMPVEAPIERRVAAVLFTDIVASTRASISAGDQVWRNRLDTHDRIAERVVTRHDGSIIKHTGDGVLAVFEKPSDAIDAGVRLIEELADSGIAIRAGIHAGEVEVRGNDITGGVVNLAARVEQSAADGEVFVSRAVRDMLIGSGHGFELAASVALKGFDGEWDLYRVTGA